MTVDSNLADKTVQTVSRTGKTSKMEILDPPEPIHSDEEDIAAAREALADDPRADSEYRTFRKEELGLE